MCIKETLKNLCCSHGWSYGIFWGFHDTNPLLLTLKDGYYEEQMGDLVDDMLLQVHVLGSGVIGQVALNKNYQWMYSESYHEWHNSFVSFGSVEDDSELYNQFSLGMKTIALISVESFGVVQFGSMQKIHERTGFVDQVKELFRNMDKHQQTNFVPSGPPSDMQFLDSFEDFTEAIDSFVTPSQPFPSASDLLLDNGDFFNFSATQAFSNNSDCSVSWPYLASDLKDHDVPFSVPSSFELSKDMINSQNSTSLLGPADCQAQMPPAQLTLDDLFYVNDFTEAKFTTLFNNDVSQATGLIPLSDWNGYNSPIKKLDNVPTNSIQSSLTDAFGSKKRRSWNETLIPFTNGDELKYSTNDTDCISEKYDVGSKVGSTSNSLFSKLGIDQIINGSASSSSFSKTRFEDQSSSASKRRKSDDCAWSHNQVKVQDRPTFCGELKSVNPMYDHEMRNYGEGSTKERGCSTSSSKKQEEYGKNGKKKKAKAGSKPRPKDRQMIQDRLAELRELIPNGEKMSIDRLLERTIKHMNFMQCLATQAETLKQADKLKSRVSKKEHPSNNSGGVTWACEVGDQAMVCPLIVEDLSTPGQMLIEMNCEEEGFFLEIVDIVRGFGLTILKGVMEVRETKLWAHFIVQSEGTRRVTRHEVFSSLIQLLQMTGQSTTNANDCFGDVISSGVPLFDSLVDTLQCGNL